MNQIILELLITIIVVTLLNLLVKLLGLEVVSITTIAFIIVRMMVKKINDTNKK